MAEVKKSPKRKFGWGSLFMLLIIGLIIFGVINAIVGTGGSKEELTPDEFLNKLGTIEKGEYVLNDEITIDKIYSKSSTGTNIITMK